MLNNFYLKLYAYWLFWVSSRSFVVAVFISSFCSLMFYISKGSNSLDADVYKALYEIGLFCFPIAFSFTFIISFLLVFRAVFSYKFKNLQLELYNCKHELIQKPNLSDVTSLWRKWLLITFWILIVFFVIVLGFSKLVFGILPSMSFINGVNMYILISIIGGLVFAFGLKRCKKVGIKYV